MLAQQGIRDLVRGRIHLVQRHVVRQRLVGREVWDIVDIAVHIREVDPGANTSGEKVSPL